MDDEPRLRLLMVALVRNDARPRRVPGWRDFTPPVRLPLEWYRLFPEEVHYWYRRLYSDPAVGEEAMVRNAEYYRDLRDVVGYTAALEAARAEVRDPYLRYVVLLMTGLFHESQGRDEEALPFYQEASALVPTARSAALASSALLFAAGQVSEAEAVLTRAVRSTAIEGDPWHLFQLHDYRFYSEWRRGLSEALW